MYSKLGSNIGSNDIYDVSRISKEIGVQEYVYETNDDYYTLRLSISAEDQDTSVPTLMLCIELYDRSGNKRELDAEVLHIESFKSFFSNSCNKFITSVNSFEIKVICFEKSDNVYIKDDKLIAEVYDFHNNKFYDVPEYKEITLQLSPISIDGFVKFADFACLVAEIPNDLEEISD